MLQNWTRWNKNDPYNLTDQIEIIYIDQNNQICLRIESTKDLDWNSETNVILGWRPVIKTKKPIIIKKDKEEPVTLVKYWNHVTRKFWPNSKVAPNPKLPHYFKVTITLNNGKIDTKYELHSISV